MSVDSSSKTPKRGSLVARKIAHDLNAPLTALSLTFEGLQSDENIKSDHADKLQLFEYALKRLKEKIQEIRELELVIDSSTTELHVLIESGIAKLMGQIQAKNLRIDRIYLAETVLVRGHEAVLLNSVMSRLQHAIQCAEIGQSLQIKNEFSIDKGKAISRFQIGQRIIEPLEFEVAVKEPVEASKDSFSSRELTLNEDQHLVVIEDSEVISKYWQRLANSAGIRAKLHSNWESFSRDQLASNEPDESRVFIVDLNFDNSPITGYEIVAKLRQMFSDVQIYVCSGDLWDPTVRDMLSRYDVKFLSKPLPTHLEIKIHRVNKSTNL